MFQAIAPGDVMISQTDIIPDSLVSMGGLELRNEEHAGPRDRTIFETYCD